MVTPGSDPELLQRVRLPADQAGLDAQKIPISSGSSTIGGIPAGCPPAAGQLCRHVGAAARSFPSGLRSLSEQLKVPWLLYAPYFCGNTSLREKFDMLVSPGGYAVPTPAKSEAFYARSLPPPA